MDGDLGRGAVDFKEIVARELKGRRADVLLHARQLRGAWDRTIQGFCASSDASAIRAGVALFLSAMAEPIPAMGSIRGEQGRSKSLDANLG